MIQIAPQLAKHITVVKTNWNAISALRTVPRVTKQLQVQSRGAEKIASQLPQNMAQVNVHASIPVAKVMMRTLRQIARKSR